MNALKSTDNTPQPWYRLQLSVGGPFYNDIIIALVQRGIIIGKWLLKDAEEWRHRTEFGQDLTFYRLEFKGWEACRGLTAS